MMSCNTPSIDQTNEAVELSFFSMDIEFSSRLSLICGAWDYILSDKILNAKRM